MSRLRNPFTMRASEKIESAAYFLRLYNPTILDALAEKNKLGILWENVIFIHSTPGAGKTSLLRVFEPSSLRTLYNAKSSPEYKEIYNKLKDLNVISEDGIEVLGVTLLCTRNYEILEELSVSSGQKLRFFFSLLNARIVLATLRSILQLYNKPFPEGLKDISFNYIDELNYFTNLIVPCNGKDLYDWASDIERKIYKAIDSFMPLPDIIPEGHDELFAFSVLKPEFFKIDNQKMFDKILFMLDDTHKLSNTQRIKLEKYIIEKRGNFNIWISERLEALEPRKNLRSSQEIDYDEINLERFWDNKEAKLKQILLNVADKRASLSTEEINSFHEYIENNLNEESFKNDFLEIIEMTSSEISKTTSNTDKFDQWLKYFSEYKGNPLERALLLKKIEILIARHLNKNQLTFDFPHTETELLEKLKNDLEAPAKLFLTRDNKIPYYHGINTIISLSSNNIEQFLSFSSDLYEEMISNKISGRDITIDPQSQERIIQGVVKKKWNELPKLIPYATEVISFLIELGDFCKKQTYQKNAPYGAGVNGFSVKENKEQKKIITESKWSINPIYEPLVNVISTCVAYNLLEIKQTKQGEKDQIWDVYYLNRWLCVKFNLPLSYGGFRHKNPDDLFKWLKR